MIYFIVVSAMIGFVILFLISLAALLIQIYFYKVGKEYVIVRHLDRTPFYVRSMTDKKMVIASDMDIVNVGMQCATIMDVIVRPQLPFEQYDGISAWGRAELTSAPREDTYFEAVLIEKGERIRVRMEVTIEARKGMTLEKALEDMVDLPIEFIYQETGRTPCHYSKVRVVITSEQFQNLLRKRLEQMDRPEKESPARNNKGKGGVSLEKKNAKEENAKKGEVRQDG